MDTAVGLVNAYLHVNGYFTVTEYPVIESDPHGARSRTDLDILAVHFADAGQFVINGHKPNKTRVIPSDPRLNCPAKETDMIIGEVKEGHAEFNENVWDAAVLKTVLVRFGCCAWDRVGVAVEQLIRHGHARTDCGHRVRLIALSLKILHSRC